MFFIMSRSFENVKQFTSVTDPSKPGYPLTDPAVTWSDVAWLKSITKLPVIIKGIAHGESDYNLTIFHVVITQCIPGN